MLLLAFSKLKAEASGEDSRGGPFRNHCVVQETGIQSTGVAFKHALLIHGSVGFREHRCNVRVVLHSLLSLILCFLLDLSSLLGSEGLLVKPWRNIIVPVFLVNEMVHLSQIKVVHVLARHVLRLSVIFKVLIFTVQISRNVKWVRLEGKQIKIYLG